MRSSLVYVLASTTALAIVLLTMTSSAQIRSGAAAFGDWRTDAPGVQRHITPADLPAPKSATEAEMADVRAAPRIVPRPDGALPRVPAGFIADLYLAGLSAPRVLRRAPNGDIFVAESGAGRIRVLRAPDGAARPAQQEVFADNLSRPYGIAFYPPDNPRFVYVGEVHRVVRYPYHPGDMRAAGPPQVIIPDLPAGGHWTRDLAVAADGRRLFVAVGSASNVAGGMPPRPPEEIRAYEAAHGRGAAWGAEENRAVVRVFDPEGRQVRNYATGLRNCSGMAIQPATGTLWCVVNERDHLGDNVPPDYATRVQPDAFYGWPWYYIGANEDPRLKGARPDLRDAVAVPDVLIQAHSATLGIAFYDGALFPPEYRGDAFVTLHGSWNRETRTGYKVVRLLMRDGRPTGVYEDFLTGFVADATSVWGRPVGVAVMRDGSLLVSEDGNHMIWRVTHRR
jgi:glucose/arabinose dehydrogenase